VSGVSHGTFEPGASHTVYRLGAAQGRNSSIIDIDQVTLDLQNDEAAGASQLTESLPPELLEKLFTCICLGHPEDETGQGASNSVQKF